MQGFKIITDTIKTRSKTSLLWIIGVLTFFMSAILDNLTSTIVMVSLIRKLIKVGSQPSSLGIHIISSQVHPSFVKSFSTFLSNTNI